MPFLSEPDAPVYSVSLWQRYLLALVYYPLTTKVPRSLELLWSINSDASAGHGDLSTEL